MALGKDGSESDDMSDIVCIVIRHAFWSDSPGRNITLLIKSGGRSAGARTPPGSEHRAEHG